MKMIISFLFWPKAAISQLYQPMGIILILNNLLPIFGVIWLGWDIFPILMLYCIESTVSNFKDAFSLLKKAIHLKGANNKYEILGNIILIVETLILQIALLAIVAGGMSKTDKTTNSILTVYFGISVFCTLCTYLLPLIPLEKLQKTKLSINIQKPNNRPELFLLKHFLLVAGSFAIVVTGQFYISLILLTLFKTFMDIRLYLRQPTNLVNNFSSGSPG